MAVSNDGPNSLVEIVGEIAPAFTADGDADPDHDRSTGMGGGGEDRGGIGEEGRGKEGEEERGDVAVEGSRDGKQEEEEGGVEWGDRGEGREEGIADGNVEENGGERKLEGESEKCEEKGGVGSVDVEHIEEEESLTSEKGLKDQLDDGEGGTCEGEAAGDVKEEDVGEVVERGSDGPEVYPQSPNRPTCAYFVMTGKCINGEDCKFNHPSLREQNPVPEFYKEEKEEGKDLWSRKGSVEHECDYARGDNRVRREQWLDNGQVRKENWKDNWLNSQEQAPECRSSWNSNQPDCLYYLNAGRCLYGHHCRFNHVKKQIYCVKVDKKEDEHGQEGGNGVMKDEWRCSGNGSCNDICEEKVEDGWKKASDEDCKMQHDDKYWVEEGGIGNGSKKVDGSYYPQRLHVADCAYYLKTGKCAYGLNCKFNHPYVQKGVMKDEWGCDGNGSCNDICEEKMEDGWKKASDEDCKVQHDKKDWMEEEGGIENGSKKVDGSCYPQRSHVADCAYYLKTGKCAYGLNCKFNHPYIQNGVIKDEWGCDGHGSCNKICEQKVEDRWKEASDDDSKVQNNKKDWARDEGRIGNGIKKVDGSYYPQRPHVADCAYYLKTGKCAYGLNCKFNHPYIQNGVMKDEWGCDGNGSCDDMYEEKVEDGWNKLSDEDRKVQNYKKDWVKDEGWIGNGNKKVDGSYYPQRPHVADCAYYLRTGHCAYGLNCKFNHPYIQNGGMKDEWGCDGNGSCNDICEEKVEDGWTKASDEDCKVQNYKKYWVKDEGWIGNGSKQVDGSYYPQGPNVADCAYYLRTGQCAYGLNCKFNHPYNGKQSKAMKQAADKEKWDVEVDWRREEYDARKNLREINGKDGWEDQREERIVEWEKQFWDKDQREMGNEGERGSYEHPQRPDAPDCARYLHTGICAYGSCCKFNHPQLRVQIQRNSATTGYKFGNNYSSGQSNVYQDTTGSEPRKLNSLGFPLRPGKKECPFYMQNGTCKFSGNCCFHHPDLNIVCDGNHRLVQKGRSPYLSECQGQKPGLPLKPAQSDCLNLMETGVCKFRSACRLQHSQKGDLEGCLLSPIGLPLRPGQPVCKYYSQGGICKFGPACAYHHPMDRISWCQG